jgi:hypothetical protein
MKKGYYSEVTEYEAGWGNKPDGFVVGTTKEQIIAEKARIEKDPSYDLYWIVDTEINLCILTEEGYKNLKNEEKGQWVSRFTFNDYVEEV